MLWGSPTIHWEALRLQGARLPAWALPLLRVVQHPLPWGCKYVRTQARQALPRLLQAPPLWRWWGVTKRSWPEHATGQNWQTDFSRHNIEKLVCCKDFQDKIQNAFAILVKDTLGIWTWSADSHSTKEDTKNLTIISHLHLTVSALSHNGRWDHCCNVM